MARCRCGDTPPDGARFCGSCGDAIDGQTGLLGVSTTVTEVATAGRIDRRFLAVAGVLIAAMIAVAARSSSSDDAATLPPTSTVPATTSPTTAAPSTTAPSTTAQATTPPDDRVVGETPTSTQLGNGEPLLGEPTGLQLVIGRVTDRPSVLDLDTGELILAPGASRSLEPVTMYGDWLVARQGDQLVSVPASDLGADPVPLLPDAQWVDLVSISVVDDGRAWVNTYDSDDVRLHLVDLASGNEIAQGPSRPNDQSFSGWSPPTAAGGPALVSHVTGGLYEADVVGGYRRVFDGRLIAADDNRLLVETCDDALVCRMRWLARDTWEQLDLEFPVTGSRTAGYTSFVAGTDWLSSLSYDADGQSLVLTHVVTGTTYEVDDQHVDRIVGGRLAISPDGRWMGIRYGFQLSIIDLVSGVEHEIEDVDVMFGALILTDRAVGYGPG